jgi:hypothetical protein
MSAETKRKKAPATQAPPAQFPDRTLRGVVRFRRCPGLGTAASYAKAEPAATNLNERLKNGPSEACPTAH